MAHDVFISYSSKDKVIAEAVCGMLEGRDIRCWIAPRDITPGADWGASIVKAISDCRVMVLIFSAHSNQSEQVKREVERAVFRQRALLPLRIEDVPLSPSLEYFISTPHWLDAMTGPLQRHLERLAEAIHLLLPVQRSSAAPTPAASTERRPPDDHRSATPKNAANHRPVVLALLLLAGFALAWPIYRVLRRPTMVQQIAPRHIVPPGDDRFARGSSPSTEPSTAPASSPFDISNRNDREIAEFNTASVQRGD